MAENKKTIVINDKEYTEDQLTDQQKIMVNHVGDLDRKIGTTQFNLDQLAVGKQAFVDMLTKSLEEAVEEAQARGLAPRDGGAAASAEGAQIAEADPSVVRVHERYEPVQRSQPKRAVCVGEEGDVSAATPRGRWQGA